jgi:hypothetical protein
MTSWKIGISTVSPSTKEGTMIMEIAVGTPYLPLSTSPRGAVEVPNMRGLVVLSGHEPLKPVNTKEVLKVDL